MARTRLPRSIATHLGRRTVHVAAPLVDGEWLALTPGELVVVGQGGIRLELAWTAIENASWDGETRTFTVHLVDGQATTVQTENDDVWLMTVALREHVNSSIVHVEFLATEAGGEVRVLVRKDSRGELSSQVLARGPISPADEAAIDELERRARAAVGLATP